MYNSWWCNKKKWVLVLPSIPRYTKVYREILVTQYKTEEERGADFSSFVQYKPLNNCYLTCNWTPEGTLGKDPCLGWSLCWSWYLIWGLLNPIDPCRCRCGFGNTEGGACDCCWKFNYYFFLCRERKKNLSVGSKPLKNKRWIALEPGIFIGWSPAFLTSDYFVRSNEIVRT